MSNGRTASNNEPLYQEKVSLADVDQLSLLGINDANLGVLQEQFDVMITVRGETMVLRGPQPQVESLRQVVEDLIARVDRGQIIDPVTISYLISQQALAVPDADADETVDEETLFFSSGTRRAIKARTVGQKRYIGAIRTHDIVFAVGPAGTGKTYLAVVMAMDYLKRRLVDRIILVRPAVEAGEQLGFLPGDLQEKINPYLRPLYDALADVVGPSKIARYMSSGVIEASPLAYMRGRTLNNAFVILDEAQNTTIGQMKMFLTRLGHQAKAVVTGDVTQIDLAREDKSGLVLVQEILRGTNGVTFVELDGRDVMRHPLVRRIVDAFQEAEQQNGGRS